MKPTLSLMMKNQIMGLLVTLFALLPTSLHAQKLSFNEEGTFKIVQFTDMHYEHGNSKSDTTLLLLSRVLDAEKPDIVVLPETLSPVP